MVVLGFWVLEPEFGFGSPSNVSVLVDNRKPLRLVPINESLLAEPSKNLIACRIL